MNEEFKEKLMQDILKTGFPLEMEISQELIRNGWKVSNSSYYIDRDENKGREIDIIAEIHESKSLMKGDTLEVVFSLVVEVKKTEDKPWIFFTSENDGMVERLLPKDYASSGFKIDNPSINGLLRINTQKSHGRLGRNFYQGFTKNGGRDDIYKALSGTTKAVFHILENSSAKTNTSGDRLIQFVEPLVIIKGNLYEAYLSENGESILEETKYIQTNFNYLSPNYSNDKRKIVHVITTDYLEEFISERRESIASFFYDLYRVETEKS